MRWLRLVGALKTQVSFAKEPYEIDYILQKRRIFLRSLLIIATPYRPKNSMSHLNISNSIILHITSINHSKHHRWHIELVTFRMIEFVIFRWLTNSIILHITSLNHSKHHRWLIELVTLKMIEFVIFRWLTNSIILHITSRNHSKHHRWLIELVTLKMIEFVIFNRLMKFVSMIRWLFEWLQPLNVLSNSMCHRMQCVIEFNVFGIQCVIELCKGHASPCGALNVSQRATQ